jgi:predicted RNase H-like nuclease (RuvC/YqgF family)
MGMPEEKKRINAVIDMDLYVKITEAGYGISEAVTKGFEKLLEVPEVNPQSTIQLPTDGLIMSLQVQVKELHDHNETLKHELGKAERDKEDLKEQLKSNDENQLLRITDLKEEISVLRKQLDTKDETIKNLTTITESQIKGYKLIEAPSADRKKSFLSRLKFW